MFARLALSLIPAVLLLAQEPVALIDSSSLDKAVLSGGQSGSLDVVNVSAQGFSRALRLTAKSLPDVQDGGQPAVRARIPIGKELRKGDTLYGVFWMRSYQCDNAAARIVLQRSDAASARPVSAIFAAGTAWRRVTFPFTATEDYAPGAAALEFVVGFESQGVEIGGLTLIDYGQNVPFRKLPGYAPYAGWEPDAPWRAQAAARIDRIRKADLKVRVVEGAGKAVPGAQVHARMLRHRFGFGTAVAADAILGSGPDNERYRRTILEYFNKVVTENDLKWPNWERNRTRALDGIAWLKKNGIDDIRGHNLVWPGWRWLPPDLRGLAGDPAAMRKRVFDHIREIVSATRGITTEWDVVNEPYTNRDILKILGDAEMSKWFAMAREFDPGAKLFINDFSILSSGGNDIAHQNFYYKTIRALLDSGAPVDGIGMQGHFGAQLTPPERVIEVLDRFAGFGRKIEITEFDIDITDEELQARYTRDFLTTVFSHPSVSSFLMWGFWEGRHWKPRGAMFRRDWSAKPNGEGYRDLVLRQWKTDESGAAGRDGVWSVRGFQGEYEVRASAGGRTAVRRVSLDPGGAEVTVVLGKD